MTEKRESSITLARAVALVLVIYSHCMELNIVAAYRRGFGMPAFFLLYGVTHNSEKVRHKLTKYISNRARALMIPYFTLNLVMSLMYFLTYPAVTLDFTPVESLWWMAYSTYSPPTPITATSFWTAKPPFSTTTSRYAPKTNTPSVNSSSQAAS